MPSKYTPRRDRPPSPYGIPVSQSPRVKSQQRVWRSLSSTGEGDSSNAFAEKSRETWLRSLRQGTSKPVKGNHKLNTSLSSTSDYLRSQMGLPDSARKHKRSSSVDVSGNKHQPASYKSSEDLYDEIIALKKTLVAQKNDYDVLKAKNRRLEEENSRKEKLLQEQLGTKSSDADIRRLAESGSKSGSVVASGLKQRILKLEKQLRDKEQELSVVKSDIKLTDAAEMKTAMEIYYQEVVRLREIISNQELKSERLSSSLKSERDSVPTKIKTLRRSVMQLTSENHQLLDDNKRLKRDLDNVLNGDVQEFDSDDEEEIKYSALSKVELITMIKKNKQSERNKLEVERNRNNGEIEKLKGIVLKLKEEKNELREQNETLENKNEKVERDLDNQTDKVSKLRQEIENFRDEIAQNHTDRRRESIHSESDRRSFSEHPRRMSKPKLKRRDSYHHQHQHDDDSESIDDYERKSDVPPKPKRRPRTVDRNNAAISIQRRWREHRSQKQLSDEDGIIELQSAFRGHLTRSSDYRRSREPSFSQRSEIQSEILTEESDSEDEVVYLQSALSGHLERRSIT